MFGGMLSVGGGLFGETPGSRAFSVFFFCHAMRDFRATGYIPIMNEEEKAASQPASERASVRAYASMHVCRGPGRACGLCLSGGWEVGLCTYKEVE